MMSSSHVLKAVVIAAISFVMCGLCSAQTAQKVSLPTVKKIDINGLRSLIKPNGRPLLINFWATWCDPCREEFPDLVKISDEFLGNVDFITVSLDDLADINTYVPKFLQEMNSKIPAYLLKTPDESAAIALVSRTWGGNLPMTVLYKTDGSVAYERNGKIRPEILRENIRQLLPAEQPK